MAAVALRTEGLTKRYPGTLALSDVSIEVPEGQLRAIIGPNGAGKSTLFAIVTGLYPPSAGKVFYFGEDITNRSPANVARLGIARAFQVARLFTHLSVYENVLAAVHADRNSAWWFFRPLRSCRDHDVRAREVLERLDLAGVADVPAGTLSQGDKKRLELAMAYALDPKLLLLDEPTAGMSPAETRETIELLRRLHDADDITILLTEHDMRVVFALAEQVTVLHQGQVLADGPPEAIRDDPRVVEVYLGEPVA